MASETTRTAFVSGSGRNIGRAIAVTLAKAGRNIVVNGSSDRAACEETAKLVRAEGVAAEIAMGNVGDPEAVKAIARMALDRFGRVEIVINNAAVRPEKPFLELTSEDWRGVLAVDLDAAFYTARAFLPGMIVANWGRIINFAGMNAIQGYIARAPVSVAKHGVWGLTKSLAREFGPHGVTVNTISPGPIGGDYSDPKQARHIEEMITRVPLGRLGRPHEVASLCGLLCSDDGGFISGQMIACNGAAHT